MAQKRITFAAKWSPEDLEEIKTRARARDLNTSEYVRRCAMGLLDATEGKLQARMDRLEERLQLLEERAENTSSW